jgi:hypothetical protein
MVANCRIGFLPDEYELGRWPAAWRHPRNIVQFGAKLRNPKRKTAASRQRADGSQRKDGLEIGSFSARWRSRYGASARSRP